jgi:bifunctional non-homologous end joining protein LigD
MGASVPPPDHQRPRTVAWPLPPAGLRPMLAVPVTALPTEPGWAFEPKWDGYRGIGLAGAGQLRITSRRGNDMAPWFPELAGLADALGDHQALVDGELVALDPQGRPDFGALQQRMRRRRTTAGGRRPAGRPAGTLPVVYMVFDLLGLDGRLLLERPWTERRQRLEALELAGPAWQTTPSFVDQGAQVWAATGQQGLEGVVAKRLNSRYQPGRRHPDWRKRSHEHHGVFVVGGFVPGPAGVDLLLVGTPTADGRLRHLASVQAGLVPATRGRLARLLAPLRTGSSPFDGPVGAGPWAGRTASTKRPVWVRAELQVVIAYRGLEGGQLRHPSYAGLYHPPL